MLFGGITGIPHMTGIPPLSLTSPFNLHTLQLPLLSPTLFSSRSLSFSFITFITLLFSSSSFLEHLSSLPLLLTHVSYFLLLLPVPDISSLAPSLSAYSYSCRILLLHSASPSLPSPVPSSSTFAASPAPSPPTHLRASHRQ